MTREFIMLPEFDKQWKTLSLTDNELRELQTYLCSYPNSGNVMEGTGGLRKLRWPFEGQGKSGSIRVLYVDFNSYKKVYLITVYPKSEKDNLTKEERNTVKNVIKNIEKELEKKKELERKRKK